MTTAIAINGACGRMGLTLGKLAAGLDDFHIAAVLETAGHPSVGGPYVHAPDLKVEDRLGKKVDALIDFSTPSGALERLSECVGNGSPAIICTTAFSADQEKQIESAASKVPVVFASNMSVGINLLFRVVPEIARALGDEYDVDVVETHHRNKKDSPSGTAVTLLKGLGRRATAHSLRSGDEVGEHKVVFGGPGERIEVIHRATTREVFARGALRAAEFVSKAKPGLYTMLDVIARR